MNKIQTVKICETFYASHYYPIACFDDKSNLLGCFATLNGCEKLFDRVAKQNANEGKNPKIVYDIAGLYGCIKVNDNNHTVLIGPFVNRTITNDILDNIIKTAELQNVTRDELHQFVTSLPSYSYNQFLNLITFLHYILNGEEISAPEHFNLSDPMLLKEMGTRHTDKILEEDEFLHGTYFFEQQLLNYVKNGDVEGLTAFFAQAMKSTSLNEGKLADNVLRQQKNLFIGLVSMVGKSGAIKGNLDIEQTYRMIDLYTQECERCQSVDEVSTLRYNAIIDFTRRVAEMKHPEAYSNEVYSALQFIKTHTNQPIGVMDVVEHVGKSRSAFFKQFKEETGSTIAKYIMSAKLQEAKLLLAFSDRSLANISNFLYFSSQSYFNNTFKKEYGITPLAYRKRKQK